MKSQSNNDPTYSSFFEMAINKYQNPKKVAREAFENIVSTKKISKKDFSITGKYNAASNINFSDSIWKKGFLLAKVIEKWSLIVTPKIAELTSPKKIILGKLYIATDSSNVKQMLIDNEKIILKRLDSVIPNSEIKGINVSIEKQDKSNIKKFFGPNFEKLNQFYFNIYKDGETGGLIGPKEKDNLWDRHIINSAYLSKFLLSGDKVADIGTGGGFPGLVLAILRPDCSFIFIESSAKRCAWLEKQISELDLKNAIVKNARAENIKDLQFDKLTSRAVAPLKKLVPQTAHLLKKGGIMLALKGQSIRDEITEAQKQFHDFHLTRLTVLQVLPNEIANDKSIDFNYYSPATVFLCIKN
ncbi:MAG: 16S rRNA (guanine(527)-N(7))-methyltransferase RsmG [Bifidobacteriaceae bacterium]|jgi:16S rRNA (guanine527-N7)-methyltransferase|nr:16S rRNA (guanine(527)-N(7))-methyltransferase RsmG [Bifidobacteriaceae bacterium]